MNQYIVGTITYLCANCGLSIHQSITAYHTQGPGLRGGGELSLSQLRRGTLWTSRQLLWIVYELK